ncbi:MAG: Rrf2 family transcriptional regulator [Patescibacteria group bacterium]
MHFQKNEHYGLLLMGELACIRGTQPRSLIAISRRHGVSLLFLKKIVRSLKASGLVESKEGIGGGYILARKPETISMWEIISAFQTNSDESNSSRITCPVNTSCLPQHIRARLSVSMKERLEEISLKEVTQ